MLRRSKWYRGCSTSRIWAAAATILWQVHQEDPDIPLDPELFVAAQPLAAAFADPWLSLAHPDAGRRYYRSVRRIIRRLRAELRREIGRAEDMVRGGLALATVLRCRDRRLSPLGLFITAHRAGRPDLAVQLRPGAIAQHQGCPLYRLASRSFLSAGLYPVTDPTRYSAMVEDAHVRTQEVVLLN
ncbi:MAG: hypothetical protein ACP5XB_01145 [Isosphaeraceae bacterium]